MSLLLIYLLVSPKVDYSLSLVPPASELAHVVVGLAVELGCSRVLVITSSHDKHTNQDILTNIERMAFQRALFFGVSTADHEDSIKEIFKMQGPYDATMIVLYSESKDTVPLLQATRLLGWKQFIWLVLEPTNEVVSTNEQHLLPSSVLGVRLHHVKEDWLNDALTLVNHTLQEMNKIGANNFDADCSKGLGQRRNKSKFLG